MLWNDFKDLLQQTLKLVLKDFRAKETHEEISTRSRLICRHHTHFTSEWWSGLIWYIRHYISQRCSLSHTVCVYDGMTLYRKIRAFQHINKNMRRTRDEKRCKSLGTAYEKNKCFPCPCSNILSGFVSPSNTHARLRLRLHTHSGVLMMPVRHRQTVSTCSRNIMPYKCICTFLTRPNWFNFSFWTNQSGHRETLTSRI